MATAQKKTKWYFIGGPENNGYWGGKLLPREKDLIKGIVAAKSLQTFVAILRLPDGVTLKVFHIKHQEKTKRTAKNNNPAIFFLFTVTTLTKVYQRAKSSEPIRRRMPIPAPIMVGKEIPASGREGSSATETGVGVATAAADVGVGVPGPVVGVAVGVAVATGVAVGVAVGVPVGVVVGVAVGVAVGVGVLLHTEALSLGLTQTPP